MTEITPLIIEICLHYYCSDAPYDPKRIHAPAIHEAHQFLCDKKLLIYEGMDRYTADRVGLGVYIAALCAVPLPELKWVIPDTKTDSV